MNESAPRVSAVISVVDPHPIYFRDAVHSVLGQTIRDLELVIIEEPSSRRVTDVLGEIQDSRVRHFCHTHRTSLVEQRNRGLEEARSEFVALLDADDISLPDRFEKQLAFLEKRPDIAVVGSQLEIIDSESRHIGYRGYPTEPGKLLAALPIFNPIAQPSVMFRRSAVIDVGGYQYQVIEDYELWCRMAASGYRFANLPEVLTRYRVHPQAMKSTNLRASLVATIDVKRRYFSRELTLRGWTRILAEQALLCVPEPLVTKLFFAINFQQHPP
jgi:glycosyltransferase involved in cell wall biosynthesis